MKVTNQQILQALEIYAGIKSNTQIAAELGITRQALNLRMKRLKPKIKDKCYELVEKNALHYINHLEKQSKEGKTPATLALLELSRIKRSDSLLEMDGSWCIHIEKIAPEHLKQAEQVKEIGPMTDKG